VDLVTDKTFWNFTVRYEYMTPRDSNSGFYLRGGMRFRSWATTKATVRAILATARSTDSKRPTSLPQTGRQWQTVEATIIGNRITVILNGVKIHDNVECNKATAARSTAGQDARSHISARGPRHRELSQPPDQGTAQRPAAGQ